MKEVDSKAIDQLAAFIANTPGVQTRDIMNKAVEMGYNPRHLIDATLGQVKMDSSGASFSSKPEDILNMVYDDDITPGEKLLLDPNTKSRKGKSFLQKLGGDEGLAIADATGARATPDKILLPLRKDEAGIRKMIADAGHEIKHSEDWLTRPGIKSSGSAYEFGHHFGDGIYEPDELKRIVKGIPKDEKLQKEIQKQALKKGLLPGIWKKLGMAGAVGGAAMAGSASDALADIAIPGGVEGVGGGSDKLLTDSQEKDVELVRDTNKDDKLNTARMKALQRMLGQ